MEKLYPVLKDIWKDGAEDTNLHHITYEEEQVIISMINRAYDRGLNTGAREAEKK